MSELVLKRQNVRWFDKPVNYTDEVKITHTCTVSTCERFVHSKRAFACFWCRMMYDDRQPYHCPLRYSPKQIVKVFEEAYTLKCNVIDDDFAEPPPFPGVKHDVESSYYEVDGNYCSWKCVMAHAVDRRSDPVYAQSETLIYLMKGDNSKIVPSPHWRLHQNYGGEFDDEKMKAAIHNEESYKRQHSLIFINHLFERKLI